MRTYLMTTALDRILRAPEDDAGGDAADTQVAAGGEDTTTAGDTVDASAGADTVDAGAGDDGGDKKPRVPWYNKRIDSLTARAGSAEQALAQAQREAAEAREKAAAYEALYGSGGESPTAAPAAPANGRTYTEAELGAEAQRQAQIIASNQALNTRLDDLYETGVKAYPDFEARVQQAGSAFGQDLAKRVDLFQALAKLPNASDVYYNLVGNLDHVAEVLAMGPVELGMELANMSAKATKKGPAVSRVSAPINPLTGSGGDEKDLSKVDMNEYAARREREIAERRQARGY